MEYVKSNNKFKSSDELDWNAFRERISMLDYCFNLPAHKQIQNQSSLSTLSEIKQQNDKSKYYLSPKP
jgi:hypothetical protein